MQFLEPLKSLLNQISRTEADIAKTVMLQTAKIAPSFPARFNVKSVGDVVLDKAADGTLTATLA